MTTSTRSSIEQDELASTLRPLVVGHKAVSVDGDTLTLDNGTRIKVTGASDCCAWGDATLGAIVDSEHVITSVSQEYDGARSARVFLLTGSGPALTINQEWEESNGYYFYGLYLEVEKA
jgi:hypothetical protein